MSTLHTINKSPFSSNLIEPCLSLCNANDSILLVEDGIYIARRNTIYERFITEAENQAITVYALMSDVQARGLEDKLSSTVLLINYERFVALSVEHQSIQSWY